MLGRWLAHRPKVSIGRLMVAVAIIAPFLLTLRGDEESERLAGASIVAACVAILAYKLAADAIARDQSGGVSSGRWRKIGISLMSLAIALGIIGVADISFLFVYATAENTVFNHPHFSRLHIGPGGVVVGGLSAVFVASCLRRAIRPISVARRDVGSTNGDRAEIKPDELA